MARKLLNYTLDANQLLFDHGLVSLIQNLSHVNNGFWFLCAMRFSLHHLLSKLITKKFKSSLLEIRPITIGILEFFLDKSIYLDCNQIMDRFIQRTKKRSILLTNWFWNFDSPSKILNGIQTNSNQPVTWYSFMEIT